MINNAKQNNKKMKLYEKQIKRFYGAHQKKEQNICVRRLDNNRLRYKS